MKNKNFNNGGKELDSFRLQILDFRLIGKRPVCHSDGGGIPASNSTIKIVNLYRATCGDSSSVGMTRNENKIYFHSANSDKNYLIIKTKKL